MTPRFSKTDEYLAPKVTPLKVPVWWACANAFGLVNGIKRSIKARYLPMAYNTQRAPEVKKH